MASTTETLDDYQVVNGDSSECDVIKLKITTEWQKIRVSENQINISNNEIIKLQKQLYRTCEHNFKRDSSAMSDDLFKYKCTKCSLYKNHYN